MATALAKSFVHSKLVAAGDIMASDPLETARASFAKTVGAKTTASNVEAVKASEVVILAVKPDQVAGVLAEIGGDFTKNHLLISIAAGVPLARLEAGLPAGARLIRVMGRGPEMAPRYAAAIRRLAAKALRGGRAEDAEWLDAVERAGRIEPTYSELLSEAEKVSTEPALMKLAAKLHDWKSRIIHERR